MAYTYQSQVASVRQRAEFWEARFARIYPVYFLSLMLALPFRHAFSRAQTLSVLGMVQAWNPVHPEWMGAWNYPAWSLSIEGFFYLCFPFLQTRISRLTDRTLDLLIGSASLVCVLAHTPVQGLGNWASFSLTGKFLPLPLIRLPEFLTGMGLGTRFLRRGVTKQNTFLTFSAAIVTVVPLSSPIGNWVSLVVLPFGLLIYLLAGSQNPLGSLLSFPAMLLLGGASYSVYLLPAPFRDWVRVLSAKAPHSIAVWSTPAELVLLVLLSIVVFKVWEEPMRKFIRNLRIKGLRGIRKGKQNQNR